MSDIMVEIEQQLPKSVPVTFIIPDRSNARQRVQKYLSFLKYIPLPARKIIIALTLVNGIIWAVTGVVLHYHPALVSSAVLAYTFGLRHALDADHIAAIDLTTRRLVAEGKQPATVGLWFSLGHST
jgi:high-affinity nickel-transport protein